MDWKFNDPENVAVIINRKILDEGGWIAYVTHDADDGGWQFYNHEAPLEEDAAVVSLREVVELDRTIMELADLPVGWHAWREIPSAQWRRRTNGLKAN